MVETNRTSDELNWKLAGIRDERGRVEARLRYLEEQERVLTNQGMTGTSTKSNTNGSGTRQKATPRKRKLDEATRKKMSDAAKKRWADRKSGTTQASAGNNQTDAVPPTVV